MPYKDIDRKRRSDRSSVRTKRHGNWRATIDQFHGLCGVCGSPNIDDLHEPFGEDKKGDGKFQTRIPLCALCHQAEHRSPIIHRTHASLYLDDISQEVEACGGYSAWLIFYGLPVPQAP